MLLKSAYKNKFTKNLAFKVSTLSIAATGGVFALLGTVTPASAALLNFSVSGKFSSNQTDPPPTFPDLRNGTFSGIFSYNSDAPDSNPSPIIGEYNISYYFINFFNGSDEPKYVGRINSLSQPNLGQAEIFIGLSPPIPGGNQWLYQLSFRDYLEAPGGSIFPVLLALNWQITATNDSLPLVSPDDLGVFLPGAVLPPSGTITGSTLTDYERTARGVAVVSANVVKTPEPSSILSVLSLSVLGAASGLKRKQNQKSTEKETTKVG
jgi:hypothetical protein